MGYGLEGAIPDSKAGRIIDTYGIPYFKKDDFDKGILEIYRSVINEICIEYGLEYDESYTPIDMLESSDSDDETSYSKKVLISWVALIAVVAIIVLIFGKNSIIFFGGGPRGGFFGGFGGGSGFGKGSGGFSGGFSGGGGSFGGGGAGRGF